MATKAETDSCLAGYWIPDIRRAGEKLFSEAGSDYENKQNHRLPANDEAFIYHY